jgi:hypothetical protein
MSSGGARMGTTTLTARTMLSPLCLPLAPGTSRPIRLNLYQKVFLSPWRRDLAFEFCALYCPIPFQCDSHFTLIPSPSPGAVLLVLQPQATAPDTIAEFTGRWHRETRPTSGDWRRVWSHSAASLDRGGPTPERSSTGLVSSRGRPFHAEPNISRGLPLPSA